MAGVGVGEGGGLGGRGGWKRDRRSEMTKVEE